MIGNNDFVNNLIETVKYNVIFNYRTGNPFIDMILSTVIISIFGWVCTKHHILFDMLKNFFNKKSYKASIIITAKESYDSRHCNTMLEYPDLYKSILYFLFNKNQFTTEIKHMKHIDTYCNVGDDDGIEYSISQEEEFKIADDIFGIVNIEISDSSGEKPKSEYKSFSYEMTILTKKHDLKYIKCFLTKILNEYKESIRKASSGKQYFEIYTHCDEDKYLYFDEFEFRSNRTFDNLFFDGKIELLLKLDFFLKNKKWYEKVGIPYTIGFMFHGEPGCGKTSTIKAIANRTKRHIITIPLARVKTCRELMNLFFTKRINGNEFKQDEKLYVLEDIDCMSSLLERQSKKKSSKVRPTNLSCGDESDDMSDLSDFSDFNEIEDISKEKLGLIFKQFKKLQNETNSSQNIQLSDELNLSFILNLIDGILEAPGRILIITTNHPEKLDSALKRPGRIDVDVNFKKCSQETTRDIINNFFDISIDSETMVEFVKDKYTPAELNQECIKYMSNYELLLKSISIK